MQRAKARILAFKEYTGKGNYVKNAEKEKKVGKEEPGDRDISEIRNPDQNFVDIREVKWLQESDSKLKKLQNANQSPLTFVPNRAFLRFIKRN